MNLSDKALRSAPDQEILGYLRQAIRRSEALGRDAAMASAEGRVVDCFGIPNNTTTPRREPPSEKYVSVLTETYDVPESEHGPAHAVPIYGVIACRLLLVWAQREWLGGWRECRARHSEPPATACPWAGSAWRDQWACGEDGAIGKAVGSVGGPVSAIGAVRVRQIRRRHYACRLHASNYRYSHSGV